MPIQRTKYKGISKIDRPDHHMVGYYSRVQWKKQRRAKFFSINQHGDWMGALAAALEYREKAEQELGKPRTEQLIIGAIRPSNTGVRGVRLIRENHTNYYEASWIDHTGHKRATRFSIGRHGKRKAMKLARTAREQGEHNRTITPRRSRISPVAPPARQDRFDQLLQQVQHLQLQ